MFSNFFPRKSFRLRGNVEKCSAARLATDDNMIWHMRFACWINMETHPEYMIRVAFPQQQWLRERASMLLYTYLVRLVSNLMRLIHQHHE
jgi:hypothetical protein